jgi:PAS domain S-box-containing protein
MEPITSINSTVPDFLVGGGEMGQRIRDFDWSQTSLGPVDTWPRSLRTCVQIMLTSRQPIWIGWGRELIKLYNDPYKAIVMGKHPWALGKPASVVWKEIWKDIEPMLTKVMDESTGTYVEAQLLIMQRNGYPEETYYTFSYTPVSGDDGGTEGMICFNTDDTERIISERQLRTLTALGKTLTDPKTNTEVFQRTLETISKNSFDFPFAWLYQLNGSKARLQNHLSDKITTRVPLEIDITGNDELSKLCAAVTSERKIAVLENVRERIGTTPSGAWQVAPENAIILPIAQRGQKIAYGFLVVGLNPYRLLDDKYQGFFELFADQIATSLADVHALEEERRRLEALAEIDRAKTTFFSNISHEFRTPLTLLLGPAEDLLNEHALEQSGREKAEVVFRNALRLQKLVNLLLDFSRLEAGRMEANFVPVDIVALTEDLASNFRSAIEKAGMQLIVRKESISGTVLVDVDMWEKIVLNLLSNAFKYSEQGYIEVIISQSSSDAIVSVKDTGIGIPEDEVDKIFDRFHRVQNIKGRSQEGTGIGLAMVKELVKLHGGTISVDSEVGKGSTFKVCIPKAAQAIAPLVSSSKKKLQTQAYLEEAMQWVPEHQGMTLEESPELYTGQNKRTVLLADDNADMRKYVQRLLSRDYHVIVVKDGQEALDRAVSDKPDLILTDIMMPKLNGFELLKKLKAQLSTRTIPVIFLSARAGEEARVEGIQAGADDYLTKPFSSKELLARVSNHIAIADARRRTEKEFFNLFIQSPAHIHVMKGPEHVFEFFHPLGIETIGRDITGMTVREALPELEGQGFFEMLDQVYKEGKTIKVEEAKAILKQEGQPVERYFNITYLPYRGMDGKIVGVLQFTFEVTETVKQRLKAEANEKKFRSIAQQAPIAMGVLKGPQHIVEVANTRLLEMWGRKYDEVIDKPVLQIFPEIVAQGFGELLDNVFKSGDPFVAFELPVIFKQGSDLKKIYVNLLYEPFRNEKNEIEGILAIGTDVTEQVNARKVLEETEYKLKHAVELAELGTWHIHLQDNYVEYDKRIADWWGLPEEGSSLDDVVKCIHPDDQLKVAKAVETAVNASGFYEAEYILVNPKTKHERFIHASGRVLYDENNKPYRMSGIARDITLHKMTERELEKQVKARTHDLEEANNELMRSNENLRQFAYVASHDLQEPLRKILTYSDLIRTKNSENTQMIGRDYLDKIAVGSQRMSSLIKALLQYSQVERKNDLYTEVDLNIILRNIREDFEVRIEEKNASVFIDPLPIVEAIELQMNQLFYNLVSNALKFAKDNVPPIVHIRSGQVDDEMKKLKQLDPLKKYFFISIEDNGIGFDQKFAEQIFVLFQRLHVRNQYEGTGIGLALCKKIVENHKGVISAISREGDGARFDIILPAKKD